MKKSIMLLGLVSPFSLIGNAEQSERNHEKNENIPKDFGNATTKGTLSLLLSRSTRSKLSKEGSLRKEAIEKARTASLIKILKALFSNKKVGPFLALKGGKAAFFFHNLSRSSDDLDFDLLNEDKADAVFQHIKDILSRFGLLRSALNRRYTLSYELFCTSKLAPSYTIHIDINKRSSRSLYEIKQFMGIPLKVMTFQDIAANKMCAMFYRFGRAHKDIYDVWFLLTHDWPVNKELILRKTGLSYEELLAKLITLLDDPSLDDTILLGLGHLLTDAQKIWAQTELRKDTLFLLQQAYNKNNKLQTKNH